VLPIVLGSIFLFKFLGLLPDSSSPDRFVSWKKSRSARQLSPFASPKKVKILSNLTFFYIDVEVVCCSFFFLFFSVVSVSS